MNILCIEDDPGLANLVQRRLQKSGDTVFIANTLSQGKHLLAEESIDCVLTDYGLPDGYGIDLMLERKQAAPHTPWVVITGKGNESLAVEAMKRGASDYIVKDLEGAYLNLLPSIVKRAMDITLLEREKAAAENQLKAARDRLRSLFDSSLDLLAVCDTEGICREISDQALLQYSVNSSEFLGKDFYKALGISPHQQELDQLGNGQSKEIELNIRLGKKTVPVSVRSRALSDGSVLLCFRDVSIKQALQSAQRTVSVIKEERDRYQASSKYLNQELKRTTHTQMTGSGVRLRAVMKTIEQAAIVEATVLVTGETGTGKELVANLLHELSERSEQSLIKVNCAALPTELVESELFGHVKGSFTGAYQNKVGRFEAAHHGTLVLDEIGEFPLLLQAKLLRALQSGEFQRIGSNETKRVNVRVVALTNRNLKTMIDNGQFREDLYYRLNVIPIELPPLRERGDDIKQLFDTFVADLQKDNGAAKADIPTSIRNQLMLYEWPGNIRELRNYVERGLAIGIWTLPNKTETNTSEQRSEHHIETLSDNEKQHILRALTACQGVISGKQGAATLLDINPNTLRARMDKLGIKADRGHS